MKISEKVMSVIGKGMAAIKGMPVIGKGITVIALLAIFLSVMLFDGCDGLYDDTDTFDLTVNFEQFKTEVQKEFDSAPFRIVVVYGFDEDITTLYVDTALNEDTFQIPQNALFVNILTSIQDVTNEDEQWASMTRKYIFNADYNLEELDPFIPYYVEEGFSLLQTVKAVVKKANERIELYFNGEPVDINQRLVKNNARGSAPSGIPLDPRPAGADTHISRINNMPNAFRSIDSQFPTKYCLKLTKYERKDQAVTTHIQGFGYYRNKYALSHSRIYFPGAINILEDDDGTGRLYFHDEVNKKTSRRDVLNKSHHPGGFQIIGDYLVGAADMNSGSFVYINSLYNEPGSGSEKQLAVREGISSAAATGITDVSANLYYGSNDTTSSNTNEKKYIIAVHQYGKQLDLYRSKRTNSLWELNEDDFTNIGSIDMSSQNSYDNIQLFTDTDGQIWMIGFDSSTKRGAITLFQLTSTDSSQTNKRNFVSKLTNNYTSAIFHIKNDTTGDAFDISGRYGAGIYWDGTRFHVFMTERNIGHWIGCEGNVHINHWRSNYTPSQIDSGHIIGNAKNLKGDNEINSQKKRSTNYKLETSWVVGSDQKSIDFSYTYTVEEVHKDYTTLQITGTKNLYLGYKPANSSGSQTLSGTIEGENHEWTTFNYNSGLIRRLMVKIDGSGKDDRNNIGFRVNLDIP